MRPSPCGASAGSPAGSMTVVRRPGPEHHASRPAGLGGGALRWLAPWWRHPGGAPHHRLPRPGPIPRHGQPLLPFTAVARRPAPACGCSASRRRSATPGGAADLAAVVAAEVQAVGHREHNTGLGAPVARDEELAAGLAAIGLTAVDRVHNLAHDDVPLFHPEAVKGLEFDGVVVVNPHEVFTGPADARGARLLRRHDPLCRPPFRVHASLPPELTAAAPVTSVSSQRSRSRQKYEPLCVTCLCRDTKGATAAPTKASRRFCTGARSTSTSGEVSARGGRRPSVHAGQHVGGDPVERPTSRRRGRRPTWMWTSPVTRRSIAPRHLPIGPAVTDSAAPGRRGGLELVAERPPGAGGVVVDRWAGRQRYARRRRSRGPVDEVTDHVPGHPAFARGGGRPATPQAGR